VPEPVTLVALGSGLIGLSVHLARRYFEMAKEVVDVVLGFLLLLAASTVLLLCAVLIKLSSRGPVFYVQARVGKGGKIFNMYKLRTMRADAETGTGAVWATKDDPRIIPGCRWMRHSHVDELPQLINVIKGDMSLVGPRPERPEILVELEKVYPHVRERLAVRPGITGLAQVRNGYDTSVGSFRWKLAADMEYIEKRQWNQELRILMATVPKLSDKQAN
jgi:lipopolysaccharide/colanic/teichoic acid biosynthesis glycosyltransferase